MLPCYPTIKNTVKINNITQTTTIVIMSAFSIFFAVLLIDFVSISNNKIVNKNVNVKTKIFIHFTP